MNVFSFEWIKTDFGEQCLVPLENAPYPHKSRKDGFKLNDEYFSVEEHYDDPTVGFLIPQNYKQNNKINFIVHFHGHGNNVKNAIKKYKMAEQINESGKNLIMVCPQGPKDTRDSGCGKLEEISGFQRFIDESLDFLKKEGKVPQKAKIGKIILSGHSGAYYVISKILAHGGYSNEIKEVYLFDATYGELDTFANWVADSKKHRLFSIFTDHLVENNIILMSKLQDNRIFKFKIVADSELNDEILEEYKIVFSYTKLGHDNVIQDKKHLERLLKTSSIENK